MLDLERARSAADLGNTWAGHTVGGLALRLARTDEELEILQRLRFKVFTEEMNAVFPDQHTGLDTDRFDQWCEHFMVSEPENNLVIGTYRLLTPEKAKLAGAYYSESEFDISALDALRPSLVEVGRSCIHPDFRNGSAIMMLWGGIAALMRMGGYRYLLGCASVSLRDDGVTAAEVWRVARKSMQDHPGVPQVRPLNRYPVERLDSDLPARIPPLIKGYLKLGATICGEPAWDPDFNTADFPVLLDLHAMDERYKRHFGLV